MVGTGGMTTHDLGQHDGLAPYLESGLQNPAQFEQLQAGQAFEGYAQTGQAFEGYSQAEQIENLSAALNEMEALKIDHWEGLTFDERLEALQEAENQAAALGGRMPLKVTAYNYGDQGSVFTAGQMRWNTREILINDKLLMQNGLQAEGNLLDTVLHEGRHAYQFSNMYEKRTEPSDEKYKSWVMNQNTGYLPCQLYGFERYSMQPMELDARVFTEEVRANVSYR